MKKQEESEKWDLRLGTVGGTRDPRPGIHVIGGTRDRRPGTLKGDSGPREWIFKALSVISESWHL